MKKKHWILATLATFVAAIYFLFSRLRNSTAWLARAEQDVTWEHMNDSPPCMPPIEHARKKHKAEIKEKIKDIKKLEKDAVVARFRNTFGVKL